MLYYPRLYFNIGADLFLHGLLNFLLWVLILLDKTNVILDRQLFHLCVKQNRLLRIP